MQDLMRQYGPMLFRLELAGVVGAVQRSGIPDIANTVFQMAMATADAGRQWLQEAVALLPESCATPSDKRLLLQCVSQACMVDPSSHEQIEQSIWCDPQEISERNVECMVDHSLQIEQSVWSKLHVYARSLAKPSSHEMPRRPKVCGAHTAAVNRTLQDLPGYASRPA
jgi:hypothetical protein